MKMKQVRMLPGPVKGCDAIVNEAAVKDPLFCGMESIHYEKGEVQYYLCEDCYRKSLYPEGIQAKRG